MGPAIAAFREAIRIAPEWACFHHELGRALLASGDPESAIAALEQSTRLAPRHGQHYIDLAVALQVLGRYDEAREALSEVLKTDENDPSTYNALAWLLATAPSRELLDPGRAKALAWKAIEMMPRSGAAWNTLGVAEYRRGRWAESIAALERSIELSAGGSSYDYFFMAMAEQRLGNHESAREHFERALGWMEANEPRSEELLRFREEAEALVQSAARE
jgi:tetratricopeptide (TPR) repeat protein